MPSRKFQHHYAESAVIKARAEEIFAYADDHTRFSSHMSKSSWMMGGGKMDVSVDAGRGQKVGSHIRLNGKAFGITLSLDEVITQHEPPLAKSWETVSEPKLLVVGNYRMTIQIEPQNQTAVLRVSIDYDLPTRHVWLGKLFHRMYARWCVQQMLNGTQDYFTLQS